MAMHEYSLFHERQHLPPQLMAFVLAGAALAGVGALQAAGETEKDQMAVVVIAVVALLMLLVFAMLQLTTVIDDDGVHVSGMVLINRRIKFDDIMSADAITYRPLMEYGGWGFRIGVRGKAYTARGDEGVQLVLRSGERILIGSQRAGELERLIQPRIGRKR
jgi:hypothetical protein